MAPSLGRHPRRSHPWALGASKEKAPESATLSKSIHVPPLGNTIFSSSYTVVGIKRPNGGYGKGLMCKSAPKEKGPVETLTQKLVSKEMAGSSSEPLRIRRSTKPLVHVPSLMMSRCHLEVPLLPRSMIKSQTYMRMSGYLESNLLIVK